MEHPVILKTYPTRGEAEIARGYLESEGIPAQVVSDDAGGNLPQFDLTNGVHLVVDSARLARAKELLWEAEASRMAGASPRQG